VAVILNLDTPAVSTLALLSTLRYASMPVLMVDCGSSDESYRYFEGLRQRLDFQLMSAPRLSHGKALDRLLPELDADHILLVDSDAELLGVRIVEFFRDFIEEESVFGCGFVNGPGWLRGPAFADMGLDGAWYFERPWMPLVMFKRSAILDALEAGKSFEPDSVDNEYSMLSPVAQLRARSGRLRKLAPRGPKALRKFVQGAQPRRVYYDTGARIFEFLRYERQQFFVGLPEPTHDRFVKHFFGVTRRVVNAEDHHGGEPLPDVDHLVRQRLREAYGEDLGDLDQLRVLASSGTSTGALPLR
jgi:hypothetical protein